MTDAQTQALLTARTLSEALPYLQRYDNQTIVIKYGGHAMVDPELAKAFARDVVLLKLLGIHPVVVHGGGPQIGAMLDKLAIKSEFKDGLRVTDDATMEVVEMVLSGPINKSIVRAINAAGGKAVGLSGADGNLIRARKATKTTKDPDSNIESIVDLGYVGEPEHVDIAVLKALRDADDDLIPVVAPCRNRRGRRPLQHQCRHRRRRRGSRPRRQPPATADGCRRRPRQAEESYP